VLTLHVQVSPPTVSHERLTRLSGAAVPTPHSLTPRPLPSLPPPRQPTCACLPPATALDAHRFPNREMPSFARAGSKFRTHVENWSTFPGVAVATSWRGWLWRGSVANVGDGVDGWGIKMFGYVRSGCLRDVKVDWILEIYIRSQGRATGFRITAKIAHSCSRMVAFGAYELWLSIRSSFAINVEIRRSGLVRSLGILQRPKTRPSGPVRSWDTAETGPPKTKTAVWSWSLSGLGQTGPEMGSKIIKTCTRA
jgi:hypothetical protein